MNYKPFKYFFVDDQGMVRQLDNGVVVSSNAKNPLVNSPMGWADISILWERNAVGWANIRNFSLPLGFVGDGAKILRNDMYKYNIDRELYLIIKVLTVETDTSFYKIYYKHLYKGQFDFSTFDDDPGDSKVTLTIMEGGVSKLVKANQNTQFFIPFDNDAVNVLMDGLKFFEKADYINAAIEAPHGDGFHFLPVTFINSETNNPNLAFFSQQYDAPPSDPDIYQTSQNYFLFSKVPTNIRIKGQIILDMKDNTFYHLQIPGHFDSGDITASGIQTINIDVSFTTLNNEKLFMTATKLDSSIQYIQSSLQITFDFTYPTTTVKAFKPYHLFVKICAKLGIPETKIQANFLKTCTFFATSGDGLRGLTGTGVTTSYTDFCKAYDIYTFAGYGAQADKVVFDDRLNFFKVDNPVNLGSVKNFNPKPATDMIYSSIKIGHAEQNIQDVNGKYDFNGYHIYTTPVKAGGGKQLDMQSRYKAGPYEIESVRLNLANKNTTDAEQDKDVFILDCKLNQDSATATVSFNQSLNIIAIPNGVQIFSGQTIKITGSANNDGIYTVVSNAELFLTQLISVLEPIQADELDVPVLIEIIGGEVYSLDRSVVPDAPTFDTNGNLLTGVPDPGTIFNVRLRPSALFQKHYRWIRSWLYNYEPGIIKFEQANMNGKLIVGGIMDGADVNIASMGDRLFLPYYFEFLTKVPVDLVDVLDTDINTPFTSDWDNNNYGGFMFNSGIAMNTRAAQTFKLLSWPTNDVTKLI